MKFTSLLTLVALALVTAVGFISTASPAAGMQDDPPSTDNSFGVITVDPFGSAALLGFGNLLQMSYPAAPSDPPAVAYLIDYDTMTLMETVRLEPGDSVERALWRHTIVQLWNIHLEDMIIDVICANDCLPGGTAVATPRGPRPISSLSPGDRVLSGDGVATIERVHASRSLRLVDVAFGEQSVRATVGHAFRTGRGWVRAGDLRVGDEIETGEGQCSVTALRRPVIEDPVDVYDLELRGARSFRVGEARVVVAGR